MAKEILTSLHGNRIGLGNNDELMLRNPVTGQAQVIADLTASLGAAAGTGVTAVTEGNGIVNKTTFTFADVEIALADEAGVVAYGGLKFSTRLPD